MQNLIDPAILFFVFGVLAGALKSNLEIPQSIAKFLSLYLLVQISRGRGDMKVLLLGEGRAA